MERRQFLQSVLSTAATMSGIAPPAAAATHVSFLHENVMSNPSAAAPPALTTLDATVALGDPGDGGYRKLVIGPGESFVVRTDLTYNVTSAPVVNVLAAFVQMTDLHIVDDQSPLRVEFLDRYADDGPPHFGSYPFKAAYRAHESMSTHVVDAMCRAIRKAGHGPKTLLPLAFIVMTGDAVDNCQYNEVRWYIDLLDGQAITPNSGHSFDHSVTGDSLGLDIHYWHPSNKQFELSNLDGPGLDLNFQAGFPEVLNLPAVARTSFTATGLGMPWYSAYGNHDALVQGNVPIDDSVVSTLAFNLKDFAVGEFKPSAMLGLPDQPNDIGDFVDIFESVVFAHLPGVIVPADGNRRLLSRAQFIQEHFVTAGSPVGHGFREPDQEDPFDRAYYVIPDSANDLIRHVVLDTTYPPGGANGWLSDTQFQWLESLLRANSSRYVNLDPNTGERPLATQPGVVDKLFVIYSHHTSNSMDNGFAMAQESSPHSGTDLVNLLLRYPNVILWVNGHNHKNTITPHQQFWVISSGFWEVTTASHIDWPYQSRILEVAEGDGTLSVFTTMVDIDAPLDWRGGDINTPATLASLSRELAANDLQQRTKGVPQRPGSPLDRNTQLLIPAPFAFPPALRARATTPITAVARSSDRIDVFAAAYDGRTMTNWWSATTGTWAGWSQISGGIANGGGAGSPITAIHRSGTRIEAFTVGTNGRVYTAASEVGAPWSDWFEVPGGLICRPGSTVTVISRDPGKLDLFTTASTGRIMSTWWNTEGGWPGSWFNVSGGVAAPGATVTAIARRSTHIDVFSAGTDGRVYSTFWDVSSGWSNWFQVPATPICRSDSTVAVIARDPNKLDLFTTASDGRIMSTWWHADAGWSNSWFNVSGGFARPGSAVTAVARHVTHIDLFVVGLDRQVYSTFWDVSSGWSNWFPLSQKAFSGGQVAVVCRTPNVIDVFTVGAGGVDPLPVAGRSVGAVCNSRWPFAGGWPVGWSVVKNDTDHFPPPVTVPNLVGKRTAAAVNIISGLGLASSVDVQFTVNCNATPDVVIKQDPTPGIYNLPPGSTIAITIPNTTGCIPP
jgi:metallophosphoesterase (TIGR03767 family)